MGRTGQQMRQRTVRTMKASGSPKAPRSIVEHGRSARLRYWFDNSMSRGTSALVAWLALVTLGLILVFTLVTLLTGWAPDAEDGSKPGFSRQMFNSLMHALDPGTVAGDAGSWRFLVTMLLLTLGGLFIVSALIGVIATGIDAKLMDLRRGRSVVIESGHTVVLGWSDAVFAIVRELSIANESRRKPVIVILSERDKVEMEDEIREKIPDLRGTRVICRTGSPIDIGDLALSSHARARSVIVLSPEGDEPDSEVIKSLLALTHDLYDDEPTPRVVAEIQDPQNLEAARMVGRARTVLVDKRETIARLIVQTARQSGAAAVYTELFDFDGDEVYFHDDASLATATFAEARHVYESATVIGLADSDGSVTLNPQADTPIGGLALVVIAEDDSALRNPVRSAAVIDLSAISDDEPIPQAASRSLVIGWNERAASVVRELDAYAEPGSQVLILTEFGNPELPPLVNLTATVGYGKTAERSTLERWSIGDLDQIIVLCYSDQLPAQRADARTLVTLLHLREIIGERDAGDRPAIVSEMLDDRNRALAQVTHVDDVIVSDEILSLMLSQLSEDARLEHVFGDLLDADGSEIYLRPVSQYVNVGRDVNFATIVESASRRGETAIGYRVAALAGDPTRAYGVHVNPRKSRSFVTDVADRVIVLAED